MRSQALIATLAILTVLIVGCAQQPTKEPVQNTAQSDTLEYSVAEFTNATCRQDSDCETPVSYLIRSNCPYGSKCIQERCAVICPNLTRYNDAIETAWQYVENMQEYKSQGGRDIQVLNITTQRDGFVVDMQFVVRSAKDPARLEYGTARLFVADGKVVDGVYTQGVPAMPVVPQASEP